MQLTTINNLDEAQACFDQESVLVFFGSAWCQPCQHQLDILATLPDGPQVGPTGYQVDVEEFESLAQRFHIEGLPTLIWFQQGAEVCRSIGVQSAATLNGMIEMHNRQQFEKKGDSHAM